MVKSRKKERAVWCVHLFGVLTQMEKWGVRVYACLGYRTVVIQGSAGVGSRGYARGMRHARVLCMSRKVCDSMWWWCWNNGGEAMMVLKLYGRV